MPDTDREYVLISFTGLLICYITLFFYLIKWQKGHKTDSPEPSLRIRELVWFIKLIPAMQVKKKYQKQITAAWQLPSLEQYFGN